MLACPRAVAISSDSSCGTVHSPAPSAVNLLPATVPGSIAKARLNESLAAMIVSPPSIRTNGALELWMTASNKLSSITAVGAIGCMLNAFRGTEPVRQAPHW